MLKKLIKRTFRLNYAQINASKHNYIKAPADPRLSHAWIGRVFIPKRLAQKEAQEKYLNPSVEIIFTYLKTKYPEFTYKLEDYNKIRNNTFFVYNINLKEEKKNLLEILSENLVLSDHQFRHFLEKNKRNEFSNRIFENLNLGEITIKEFFEYYSELCELLVSESRKFNNLESDIDFKGLERIFEKNQGGRIVIEEGKMNFVNRFMQYLHS